MAQLKDTVVSGNLRVTDTVLAEVVETDTIKVHESSSSDEITAGENGQVLATDGNKAYWEDVYTKTQADSTFATKSQLPTIDAVPTSGSTNAVSSGGVYTAINDAQVWEAGNGSNSAILKGSEGTAAGNYSTVEGYKSETGGSYTSNNISISGHDGTNGSYSHAEGLATIASGPRGAHAEGAKNLASGAAAHVEGGWNKATGQFSHAEGYLTTASNESAHAEGSNTTASGIISHAEGQSTTASSSRSHAEGYNTVASGNTSHAEGAYTKATNDAAHSEGYGTIASGDAAHSEGKDSIATGNYSHAEGHSVAKGILSHSENGDKGMEVWPIGSANATTYTSTFDEEWRSVRTAVGDTVFANIIKSSEIELKSDNTALPIKITDASYSGDTLTFSTESTLSTTALSGSTEYWINMSMAYGARSHSENMGNTSYGEGSHAEGEYTVALGNYSHVEGGNTLAQNSCEHAEGQYNKSNKVNTTFGDSGNTIHSVGIGTGTSARKNAFEVMQNGDAYLYGLGTYDGTNPTSGTNDIKTIINGKQATLVSGTNIKTINNESILGSGNITISSGVEQEQADWKQNDNTQVDFIKNRTHYITETTYDSGLKSHIATYGRNLSTNEYYFSVTDAFVVTSSTPADVTSGVRDFVLYNYEYNLVQNTYPENSSSFVLVYEAIGYLKAGAIAPIQRHLYRITFNCGIVSGGLSISNPIAQHISPTAGTATTLTAMGGKIITFHKLDNRYLDIDSVIDSKTSDFVPKSGTTEMSDDAELVFPSEDWDERNDTGYATKISHQGVHSYDPDDGFELHMDSTDLAFVAGYYGGSNTQYGRNSIYNNINSSTSYSYNFPNKGGTFAVTSDIPSVDASPTSGSTNTVSSGGVYTALGNYLPLSGGAMDDGAYIRLVEADGQSEYSTSINSTIIQINNPIDGYWVAVDGDYPGFTAKSNVGSANEKTVTFFPEGISYKPSRSAQYNTLSFPAKTGTLAVTSDIPTFYTGTTDPSSSLGSNGDIYLKISS